MHLQRLRRTLDATRLNDVANDPCVRPWLGGDGVIDLAPVVANPNNIALEGEHGGFILIRHEIGIYEAHTLLRKEGRGRYAVEAATEGFRYLFTATDCVEVQTRVPEGNKGAARFAAAVGFQEAFRRERAWPSPSGPEAVSFQTLTFDRWRARDPIIAEAGHWFHDQLEGAKRTAGSSLDAHPDDEAHDRAVGAAVLMMRAGNPRKGVWLYNRWARLAGYETIDLLSDAPAVIDVRDAIIEVRGDGMEVIACR